MTYQHYSNTTKHLYCTNNLHSIHIKKIHPSTRYYWRELYKNNPNIFDPNETISNTISNLQGAIAILLDTLPKQKNKKKFWKKHKLIITDVINECNSNIDKLQILQLLNISPKAFAKWTSNAQCRFSEMNLCVKKYPNQLREEEKEIIRKYMTMPEHKFLRRSQVFWKMRNQKALMISLNTFHKYCNLLGLYSQKQKKEDKRKTEGITADTFLQKIHLDITYLGLLNSSTAYILNIVDNHTRFLLETKASLTCNSNFVASVLEPIIIKYKLNDMHTEIFTDGGSENEKEVIEMLKKYPNIKLTVCKRDTIHLNNIVEAAHKRFKNNVLPHNFFTDIIHLQKSLPQYHEQYNNLPQQHLLGMTPNNAINGITFDKEANKILVQEAVQRRKAINMAMACCKI